MISASWQYIGELAVPVSTWMKSGPLTVRETDEARLHPYHGERALAVLGGEGKAVAALVLRHHERLDGSGYHRYVRGSDLSPAARILAAAEAFQTAREARPHRPALSDLAAAAKLRIAVREGKLCPDAVEAVLACAGQPAPAGKCLSAWRG
jgi:HD-GYP domain-containing protein (c-di-GMP phosphodiesterase class II)